VERYIDTPVKRYSSGMYVRLAFAVAAHLESEILIVDEVLAVGDAEFQKKCLGKMGEVSKGDGRTVLFVSHNMAAVGALCNKAIVLKNGVKVFDGQQKEGVKYYLSQQSNLNVSKQYFNEREAPGDHRAKILAVEALPGKGETINFENGIKLVFTIKSYITNSLLDISFNVKSHDQTILFHHGNYVTESKELKQGIYKVEAHIPPYLLNEGSYSVDVWLGLGATEMLGEMCTDIISFDMERSNIDHIIKTMPGVLRPKLRYEINYAG
jgi:lipopolysaccharide transport system ATP-binding protein